MEKHLFKENNHSQYTSNTYDDPSVICDIDHIHYNRPTNYETLYLTFETLEDCVFSFTYNTLYYSMDGGANWLELPPNTSTNLIKKGRKIIWKCDYESLTTTRTETVEDVETTYYGIGTFSSTGKFIVYGNIMSLLYADNFENQKTIPNEHQFRSLFEECQNIVFARDLILPATSLKQYTYYRCFFNCVSLVLGPRILPATTVAGYSYAGMFQQCASLKECPEILATSPGSYGMFCMFRDCISLREACEIHLTVVHTWCLAHMFYGCSSLVKPPSQLPVTSLQVSCYERMFMYCTSLEYTPILPINTNKPSQCYSWMFRYCSKLKYIKCYTTQTPASAWCNNCFNGVASQGIYVKNINATWSTNSYAGNPSNWTVIYYNPSTNKYYLSDKTTECDDHGNIL